MWNDIELLTKLARMAPYIFIGAGALIAFSGQFVSHKLDDRVAVLKETQEQERKATPPMLEANLGMTPSGEYIVIIEPKNMIPFKASWMIVSREDIIVSGIMMSAAEFTPTDDIKRWTDKPSIQWDKVADDYLEFRLTWYSAYFSELGQPDELKGEITKGYRVVDGKPVPIDP